MRQADPAERLLKSLGITEPEEIELEDIAFDQGAEVRFCNLSGCEADILGFRNKAIIWVISTRTEAAGKSDEVIIIVHDTGRSIMCTSQVDSLAVVTTPNY